MAGAGNVVVLLGQALQLLLQLASGQLAADQGAEYRQAKQGLGIDGVHGILLVERELEETLKTGRCEMGLFCGVGNSGS